jgi:Domain of unknown function (DUF4157)/Lysine-specific metallo-endopeptidase
MFVPKANTQESKAAGVSAPVGGAARSGHRLPDGAPGRTFAVERVSAARSAGSNPTHRVARCLVDTGTELRDRWAPAFLQPSLSATRVDMSRQRHLGIGAAPARTTNYQSASLAADLTARAAREDVGSSAPPISQAPSAVSHEHLDTPHWSVGGIAGQGAGVIQRKLAVGAVDDPLEREADSVAEQVVGMRERAHPAPIRVSRKCRACEDEERDEVRRKHGTATGGAGSEAPHAVEDVLQSPGRPLDAATRDFFEPRFAYDFSHVRVHTDERAHQSTLAVNAQAYTSGRDIVFRAGEYQPHTPAGVRLLAHELTHVVQHGSASRAAIRRQTPAAPALPASAPTAKTSDCDTTQSGLVSGALSKAQSNIAAILPPLSADPLTADMENALWIYFRDTSTATAARVAANLKKIAGKLSDITYECENDCESDASGSVLGYTRVGTALTGIGHIHLCMNTLKPNADDIAWTMIHEAAHFVFNASDSAGYYGTDCSETESTAAAGPSTKLDTADSYNCLVQNWVTRSATDRANTRGDISGANIAGIRQSPPGPIDLTGNAKKLTFSMNLTRGGLAVITGVSYRWIFRDDQDRSYQMTSTNGTSLFVFKPAAESVLAIFHEPTRNLLKQRGITSGKVLCRAQSPVFGEKLFELAVTFGQRAPAPTPPASPPTMAPAP